MLLYLKSPPSNLWNCKTLQKKKKMVKIGIKNALFGYFCARFLKNYCHIWNQTPQINQIAKFHKKMKIAKFGTKYVLLSIFDQECLIWLFYGQNF